MHYVGISTYQFIPYNASATHKHTHARILKPFEDSEPKGLQVDIYCPDTNVYITVDLAKRGVIPLSMRYDASDYYF